MAVAKKKVALKSSRKASIKASKIKVSKAKQEKTSYDNFMKENHIEMVHPEHARERYRRVPLSNAFMLGSIVGFVAFAMYTAFGRLDLTWGLTFCVVFMIMIIASVISVQPE